jgi:hypothetical protein
LKKKCNDCQKSSTELRRWEIHEKEMRRASGSEVMKISNFNESSQERKELDR